MVIVEKINDKLVLTIECNHSIVNDCFLFGSLNAPSEGKRLIMEVAGEAYENYVRGQDHPDERNKVYFDNEFSKIKIVNNG